jgi:hypothetical protein
MNDGTLGDTDGPGELHLRHTEVLAELRGLIDLVN